MVTLRFTRRLLDFMGFDPIPEPEAPTAVLGDWYGNIVVTARGKVVIFVNERTLLSVAVAENQFHEIIPTFVQRVYNLFCVLKFPHALVEQELQEIGDIQVALVKNQRVTAYMNQIAAKYRRLALQSKTGTLNLGNVELELSDQALKVLGFKKPSQIAHALLTGGELGAVH